MPGRGRHLRAGAPPAAVFAAAGFVVAATSLVLTAVLVLTAALTTACGSRAPSQQAIDPQGADAPAAGPRAADPPGAGAVAGLPRPGTRRMAARLEEIVRGLDPSTNRFINSARIDYLRQAVKQAKVNKQKMVLTSNLADELLKAGRTQEAIEVANYLLNPPADMAADAPPPAEARAFLALCYLRLGEQQNHAAACGLNRPVPRRPVRNTASPEIFGTGPLIR